MTKANDLPAFDRPPVIEVVCGVLFRPVETLLAPHLGLLWERFREEYPVCQEVAPLARVIERFDDTPAVQIELSGRPPLPRIWFVHENETGIIQVQRDRFLHNWRKIRPDDEYPRYESVIQMFRDHLVTLESFLDDNGLGSVVPEQYEMTYVNHIPCGVGLNTLAEVGTVLPDFCWGAGSDRFLGDPESFTWKTSFVLPDQAGRLHATIRSGLRREDKTPILLFELTARGMAADGKKSAMWAWFDLAHEWIVRGFIDLTSASMHKNVWKRTT